jgi:hypothetical protein
MPLHIFFRINFNIIFELYPYIRMIPFSVFLQKVHMHVIGHLHTKFPTHLVLIYLLTPITLEKCLS